MTRRLAYASLTALACLTAAVAALGGDPPRQQMVFRVMDGRDNPLAGVRITVRPLLGRPATPGPWQTDARGLLRLVWNPQARLLKGPDRQQTFRTGFTFQARAPGFLASRGLIWYRDRSRRLARRELSRLDRGPSLRRHQEVLVLRRPGEVLAGGLAGKGSKSQLARQCLAYWQDMQQVVRHLGGAWDLPSFSLSRRELTVSLRYLSASWPPAGRAPMPAQAVLLVGMPLAHSLGRRLLPASGVRRLRLAILCQQEDPKDPYAETKKMRVELAAPVRAWQELAAGRLNNHAFLAAHPPFIREATY